MTRHDPRKPSKPTASTKASPDRPSAKKASPAGKAAADKTPPRAKAAEAKPAVPERQRIAKLMARVGLCSRRDAEAWIVDGRVTLNGEVLTSPAQDVGPHDEILVDGEPLPEAEKTRLFLFHKPRGLVVSDHDPEGRETVADYLREHWPEGPRVVTVGRLDINTEGLLLITNDGGLARVLELPSTGWVRRYRVRAKGETDQGVLDRLHDGVTIDGIDYAGIEAKLDRIQGANCWLTMGLREGKNREIKRVLEHVGLEVNRLIRLSFGPFQLQDLPEGKVEEIKTRILRDQLGEALAAEAGVDFQDSGEPEGSFVQEAKILTARDVAIARKRAEHGSKDRTPAAGSERDERRGPKPPFGDKSRDASAGRSPRREGSDRRSDRDAAPEQEPRRERPVAGTRRHVSALRADEATSRRDGPRKRIERAATTDRNDRTVTVERLVRSRPEPEKQASRRGAGRFATRDDSSRDQLPRGKRSDGRDHASPSAMAKRVRIARSGGPTDREDRPHRDGPAPVARRPSEGFGGGKTRSVRPEPREEGPRRDARPARDGKASPARKSFGERPARPPRDGTPDRPRRDERGGPRSRDDRAPRDDRKPWDDRPLREDRKPRQDRKPGADRKSGGKPSPSREPRSEKPAFAKGPRRDDARKGDGGRPATGKGGPRPGGRAPRADGARPGRGAGKPIGRSKGAAPTRGPRPGKPKH